MWAQVVLMIQSTRILEAASSIDRDHVLCKVEHVEGGRLISTVGLDADTFFFNSILRGCTASRHWVERPMQRIKSVIEQLAVSSKKANLTCNRAQAISLYKGNLRHT